MLLKGRINCITPAEQQPVLSLSAPGLVHAVLPAAVKCIGAIRTLQVVHMSCAWQDGLDAKVLAEELLALESQFRSSVMNPMGGTRTTGDWAVNISGGPGK